MSESQGSNSTSLTICVVGYGTSTHVASRAKCFAALGHEVFLVTEVPAECPIEGVTQLVPGFDADLVEKIWFKIVMRVARLIGTQATDHVWRAVSFLRIIRRVDPDVVHVHFAYSYYGWLAGILGCHPLVVTVMGGDVLFEEQGEPTPGGKWLTGHLLKQADYITSKSHFLSEEMDRRWGVGSKVERIVWGISTEKWVPNSPSDLKSKLGVHGRKVIISPRILQRLYQIHLIVEALPYVVAVHPDVMLLITEYAPDPEYRQEIVERVSELGMSEHVKFCGQVAHDEMPKYYGISELSVAVPSSDGLPQTLLEGMACGVPNVLSQLPRYQEIVQHGETAWLVDQTPEAVAKAVLYLLDNPELCKRICRNARRTVESQGDFSEQVRRVERAYLSLVSSRLRQVWSIRVVLKTLLSYLSYRLSRKTESKL